MHLLAALVLLDQADVHRILALRVEGHDVEYFGEHHQLHPFAELHLLTSICMYFEYNTGSIIMDWPAGSDY